METMLVSRMLFRESNRVDLGSAFEVLEPYAGKLARTVLRGAGGPPGLLGGREGGNMRSRKVNE